MTEEQKAEALKKAREQFDKLKAEAEAELETDLKRRAARGVRNQGDAVEEEDLKLLDADYTK